MQGSWKDKITLDPPFLINSEKAQRNHHLTSMFSATIIFKILVHVLWYGSTLYITQQWVDRGCGQGKIHQGNKGHVYGRGIYLHLRKSKDVMNLNVRILGLPLQKSTFNFFPHLFRHEDLKKKNHKRIVVELKYLGMVWSSCLLSLRGDIAALVGVSEMNGNGAAVHIRPLPHRVGCWMSSFAFLIRPIASS